MLRSRSSNAAQVNNAFKHVAVESRAVDVLTAWSTSVRCMSKTRALVFARSSNSSSNLRQSSF